MITIVFCSLYCWCCLFFSAPSPLACVWRSSLASRFPSLLWKNAKNNPCYAGHVLSWKLKFSLPHSSLFSNVTQPCVTFWQWCCLLSVSNQDGCLLTPSARFLRSDRKIGDYKRHGTLCETQRGVLTAQGLIKDREIYWAKQIEIVLISLVKSDLRGSSKTTATRWSSSSQWLLQLSWLALYFWLLDWSENITL